MACILRIGRDAREQLTSANLGLVLWIAPPRHRARRRVAGPSCGLTDADGVSALPVDLHAAWTPRSLTARRGKQSDEDQRAGAALLRGDLVRGARRRNSRRCRCT